MDELVTSHNFYLGCRVCRILLVKSSSIFFADQIPEMEGSPCYADAFVECTDVEINQNDGFPQRLCSDCAAKLTIAYQFKKDALESDKILKSYSETEKNESEMFENAKFQDDEMFEYETIEELDDCSQDEMRESFTEVTNLDPGNDAVSFLTGILKKKEPNKKVVEVKRIKSKLSPDNSIDDSTRRHVCNVCQKRFQKRSNLIDHLRLHANVKVFACEYCDKSFVQAGNFKAHLRTHTKEKPYQCNYCSKAYSQSSSLKIHIRSHTQEKNYICDICEKGFTNASDLGKHKLIHDPNKRYKCEACHRSFTQKVHLRKHCEKHHPDMNFELVFKTESSSNKNDGKIILEECIIEGAEEEEEEDPLNSKEFAVIIGS